MGIEIKSRKLLAELLESIAREASTLARAVSVDLSLNECDLTYMSTSASSAKVLLESVRGWLSK